MEKPHFEYSAGGVVLRDGEILLVRTRDMKGRPVWTFPKGKLDLGETSEQAAVREVREETGWVCQLADELPRSDYWFQRDGHRVKKTVRWFRMSPVERTDEPDDEIDEVAWVPVAEAFGRLTYESDRKLLETATGEGRPKARPSSSPTP